MQIKDLILFKLIMVATDYYSRTVGHPGKSYMYFAVPSPQCGFCFEAAFQGLKLTISVSKKQFIAYIYFCRFE